MLDVLPKVQATRGGVKKVVDLLVVDLQEGALAEELYQVTILEREREGGEGRDSDGLLFTYRHIIKFFLPFVSLC